MNDATGLKKFRELMSEKLGKYTFTVIDKPMMITFLKHFTDKGMTQRKQAMARYCCSFITGIMSMSDYQKEYEWLISSEQQVGEFCLMTKEEVNSARTVCLEMEIIEVMRKGTSKRFAYQYKVNILKFMELIVKSNMAEQVLTDESTVAEPSLNNGVIDAEPPSTVAEHTVRVAEPALVNIYKDNKDKQDILFNKLNGASTNQTSLFAMPKKDPLPLFSNYSGMKLKALQAIYQASVSENWSNVTDTDFTYYYIVRHNEILGRETNYEKMKTGVNTKAFKTNFLDIHKIARNRIADCIEKILLEYKETTNKEPAYKDLLTFNALGTVWKVECGRVISRIDEKRFVTKVKSAEQLKQDYMRKTGLTEAAYNQTF